ncbi:MFS transporter [Salmonella enterica subsp. enterica serovar Typhimurium]|nr:MFS transporter [Salmonella enterica subsp. enterica serovar Typhimurium]
MTRYTTTDVLICGAGVTGLTLAIELARHGVSFRLIEKRTTPFIGSRGKGIQPRTQEIFEDLGILNKVVAAGGLYPRLRTYRHDGSYVDSDIAHHTKPTHAEPYHLPLMVPQNVTETIMREQLKAWGHRVEFGCELRHFAQTPRTVTAYVAGPAGEEVIIAHYLIGADGGGSFVRKNILFILLARTLFGISAGNLSAAAAYIADCTHVRNRRQAIGILTGCIGLGGIVGAGVSGWLSRISLSAPIYAAFILVLGSALVAIWGLKDPSTTSRTTDKIAAFSARAILKMPVLRVLIIVMLCHFFAYGMYSSQLPVFLSDTFIWNGLPFGPKALSYLLMADGVINIFVQLFLLGWVSQYFSERKLIILIFALLCTGFLTAGIATTIPVLVFAIVCISIADALAKPTYLAALSVHVSPARQGIVIGTAQALIAIADFISPVLGGFVLGYALYGVWIGIAISVAIIGLVTAMIYLSKSSVLIVKPETE